jgi:hypothetical protein
MGSVFPPWANTAVRVAALLAAGGAFAALASPMLGARTPWIRDQQDALDQPVEFDHRHHRADDGISCFYCHDTAYRAATAGMPSTDKCMGCHEQIWQDSPMLEMVRRSWASGAPIPWNRVHQLPGFVYFNHAVHVNKGVGCASCHGRVDQMAAVYQVAPLTMGWCLDCHREPEKYLRPLDQITNMAWTAGEGQLALGREIAAALGVRRLESCSACHR